MEAVRRVGHLTSFTGNSDVKSFVSQEPEIVHWSGRSRPNWKCLCHKCIGVVCNRHTLQVLFVCLHHDSVRGNKKMRSSEMGQYHGHLVGRCLWNCYCVSFSTFPTAP